MLPQRQTIKPGTFPAPVAGINSVSSLAAMAATDAIYCKNIDPTAYGLRVRPGYSEWANGLTGDAVKTIIPYKGTAEDGTEDLLLAATSVAIYDVTASTSTPTAVNTWGTSTSEAGWCSFDTFTNDAGARVLLVADRANGLFHYTESTGVWAAASLTGPTNGNDDIVQILIWKNRVWYVEKDTNKAWYTALGTYEGTVTEFNFGNKFRSGGHLVGLFSWTLDSGDGPDDYLVAISSAGDVVIYQGTDPSSASTFGIVGSWSVGKFPTGRRIACQFGGDLLILSSYGVVSATDLLRGANPFTYEGSISYKINRVLNRAIADTIDQDGWSVSLHPDSARIIVTAPKASNIPYTQYIFEINLKAWSIWNDVPMVCNATYDNELYFGSGNSVYRMVGNLDNVTLADSDPQPVFWSFLTGYTDFQEPQLNKVVEFLRPRFVADGEPNYQVKAFYDYDLTEIGQVISTNLESADTWDSGLWDSAIWGGGQSKFQDLKGASGMGRSVAIAMTGSSILETTLVDIGVMWRTGGML